jgi:impB/mucB/samB family C-terminal domain
MPLIGTKFLPSAECRHRARHPLSIATGPCVRRAPRHRHARPRSAAAAPGRTQLATEFGKPPGVFRLTYDTWFEVLGDKPTDASWGIGREAVRVTVKVRFAPFFTSTHGQKLVQPSADPDAVTEAALAALEKFIDRRPVRLLGIRAELVNGSSTPRSNPPKQDPNGQRKALAPCYRRPPVRQDDSPGSARP